MAGSKIFAKLPRNVPRRGRSAYRRSATIHGTARTRFAVVLLVVAVTCQHQFGIVTSADNCHRDKNANAQLLFDRVVTGKERVAFTVKTNGEAIIALSYVGSSVNKMYKIELGYNDNNWSRVQRCENEDDCSIWVPSVPTPDILSPTEPRGFWIDWGSGHHGMIKVGYLGFDDPFMGAEDESHLNIKFLGYASVGESTWNFCVESTTEAQTTPQSTTSASVTTVKSTTISQSTTQKSTTSLKTDVPSTDPRSTTPASSTDPRSTAPAPSTDVQSTTSAHSTDVQSTAQSPNAPATDKVSTNEQTTADLSHSTEQPTTAPQWTDTWADLPTSSFHPMTSSLTPSTSAEDSRCFVGHIEFDCLPESTTVEDIKNRTSEEQLPLHDLLALMTWIADHDVIPAGVANVTDYADTYVDNVDNLLDERFVETWDTAQAAPDFATNLVQSSQNLLEDLARKAPSEYQHVRKANNLEYEVLKSTNISEYSFKSRSSDGSSSTSITLEKQTIDNLMLQGNDNLSFTTLLTRKGNLIHERLSRRQPASHVIVHSLQVSGQIVSVPVTLQLKLLRERKPNEEPVCAFLDESKRSGEWSTVGCYVDKNRDTSSSISCKCNHTTSFAVLMQLQDFEISEADEKALEVLTYLLCGLSIMGLMTYLSVVMALRSLLKSERVTIHMNLSVALIVAQFLLLVSGMAAKQQVVCRVIAILMHYFFLAVFCWMLVEGAHLYFQIVRVFSNGMDKKKTYMVIGWGTPSVVVIISAASRWDDYVNYDSCWLSMESNVIWAFVGPALAIIMVNVVVLVMVVRIIVTSAAANKDKEYDHVKAGLKGSLFLLPILGLTWVFGVLSMDPNTLVFQYLFVIFNALQGVFIFLVYCAFNSEVRSAIQRSREKRALTRGDAISKASTAENFGYPLKGGWGKRNRVDVSTTCSSGEPQGQQMATLKIQTKTTTHVTTHMILTPASDGSYLTPTNVKFAAWKLDEER